MDQNGLHVLTLTVESEAHTVTPVVPTHVERSIRIYCPGHAKSKGITEKKYSGWKLRDLHTWLASRKS